MKVLMVCLGNICRSPLAHGILKHKASKEQLKIEVDSAGTGSWHIGEPPDIRSIEIAEKHDIDIKDQRARQFNLTDFDEFDLIYVMDSSNYQNVTRMTEAPENILKVKYILDEIYPNDNKPVPDPYYGGDSGFENVFSLLDKACSSIINKIKKYE